MEDVLLPIEMRPEIRSRKWATSQNTSSSGKKLRNYETRKHAECVNDQSDKSRRDETENREYVNPAKAKLTTVDCSASEAPVETQDLWR